jgi:hypothetical protein
LQDIFVASYEILNPGIYRLTFADNKLKLAEKIPTKKIPAL